MAPSSRDRISVDLRGLKAALVARSIEQGVLPSEFMRAALVDALGPCDSNEGAIAPQPRPSSERVRLSLRMLRSDREAVLHAARSAGLTSGDFVATLVAKSAVLTSPAAPATHLGALAASCAEIATLSRNLHHLTTLLRQGSTRAAQEYREMLDTLGGDVRAHLALAAVVIADLQPLIRSRRCQDAMAIA